MKPKLESVTVRLRSYGKNSTYTAEELQVQLEIRNYTDLPIRISAKNSKGELMHLMPSQLKKGVVCARNDANLINSYLNKIKQRIAYVMQFLKYSNEYQINKANIERFVYVQWLDVFSFFSEITDAEEAQEFFTELRKPDTQRQAEALEENQFLVSIGEYKATGVLEVLNLHTIENTRKAMFQSTFTKYCESINNADFPLAKFDKNIFDKYIRFVITLPTSRKGKAGETLYYSVKSIENLIKEIRIYLKALENIGYVIDKSVYDFKLIKGNRTYSHVKFINSEKANVYSITKAELDAIKAAINNKKLKSEYRQAATLFLIQTYLGGLRKSELNCITKDSFRLVNGKYYCFLTTQKTKKQLDSPLHNELLPILQSIDFDLNRIKFKNSKGADDNYAYNENLKALAKEIDLNREIVQMQATAKENLQEVKTAPLYELITNKLARKALVTLLFNKGYTLEQIATITKHSLSAIQYYCAILNDEKESMINKL